MESVQYESNLKTKNEQDTLIRDILRSLGLNTSHKGTILLIEAIKYVYNSNTEFIIIDNIYSLIKENYKSFNISQIKMTIKYAIDHRIEEKTVKNFKRIFGFDYDEYIFTNNNIIEEIARII